MPTKLLPLRSLLLLLVVFMVWTGSSGEFLPTASASISTSTAQTSYSLYHHPWVAAYNIAPWDTLAKSVRAFVSYPYTDPSQIQSDNHLYAGIVAQGQDNGVDFDYVYVAAIRLLGDGSVDFAAEVIVLNPPAVSSASVFFETWSSPDLKRDSRNMVEMEWNSNDNLDMRVYVDGYLKKVFTYVPFQSTAQRLFHVGTQPGQCPHPACGQTVKTFMFGVGSRYPIGHAGWSTFITLPMYKDYFTSQWIAVSHSKSVRGSEAFVDDVFKWGGDVYTGVNGFYKKNTPSWCPGDLQFYWSGITLPNDTLLWEPTDKCPDDGGGRGGGGSPHLSTWNGTAWVLDNNLMPAAEHSNGKDVTDYYRIQQPLGDVHGEYRLRISEFENAHNYIDQVQLLTVDHGANYNVAASPTGQLLTYSDPVPARKAVTSNGTDVTRLLDHPDDVYYQQFLNDALYLDFTNVRVVDRAKLLIRSDPGGCPGPCQKSWFDVYVKSPKGWLDIADIFPRKFWYYDIVDLSSFLKRVSSSLVVKIGFDNANGHKIDFVGLDTTAQQALTVTEVAISMATHSVTGDVTIRVREDDLLYGEILPGQSIVFTFTVPSQMDAVRDFVLISNGYYSPIFG